jgi:hypothetical protein
MHIKNIQQEYQELWVVVRESGKLSLSLDPGSRLREKTKHKIILKT